jgi:hypothetical protein
MTRTQQLKGFEISVNSIFIIFLSLMVLVIIFAVFTNISGTLNQISQLFCSKSPEWCGQSYPDCVCCQVNTNVNLLLDIPVDDDLYEYAYFWTTEERCRDFVRDGSGNSITDPNEFDRCGNTNQTTVAEGIIFKDRCTVPSSYVRSSIPECVCCKFSPQPGVDVYSWEVTYMCRDKPSYELVNEALCGALWTKPEEARHTILLRTGELGGAPLCDIPYPYNLTESP